MWRKIVLLVVIAVSMAVSPAFAARYTVGITDFDNRTNIPGLSESAMDILSVELTKNPQFRVAERIHINSVIREQLFDRSAYVDQSTAADIGRVYGLDYLVIGTISNARLDHIDHFFWDESQARVTVTVKIIEANTGIICMAESVEGSISKSYAEGVHHEMIFGQKLHRQAIGDATEKAVREIAERISHRALTGLE